jgi:hypothetical protein
LKNNLCKSKPKNKQKVHIKAPIKQKARYRVENIRKESKNIIEPEQVTQYTRIGVTPILGNRA